MQHKDPTDDTNIPAQISNQQVHLWLCESDKVIEPLLLNRYKTLLTEEEITKMKRYRFEKHQHQYLITRAMIRSLLSHYQPNIAPQDWRFDKNHWGKPSIVSEQNPEQWAFNLSHTEGLIVCAFTQGKALGVDVEDISRSGETIKIADRYFSPEEYKLLTLLPEAQQNNRFFDLWTLKESYIKACGKGLAIPLDEFSFSFPEDNPEIKSIELDTKPARKDKPSLWQFWNWSHKEQYRLSLGIKHTSASSKDISIKTFGTIPLMSQWSLDNKLTPRHN